MGSEDSYVITRGTASNRLLQGAKQATTLPTKPLKQNALIAHTAMEVYHVPCGASINSV
jgi:hypothetical protein